MQLLKQIYSELSDRTVVTLQFFLLIFEVYYFNVFWQLPYGFKTFISID